MATTGAAVLAGFRKMRRDKQKNTDFFLKSTFGTFVAESAADASGDYGVSLTDC